MHAPDCIRSNTGAQCWTWRGGARGAGIAGQRRGVVHAAGQAELLALRQRLKLSRPVLASYLRTNPRTLENWEQGRAKPNAQAALLIRMVEKFPDTVDRLAAV